MLENHGKLFNFTAFWLSDTVLIYIELVRIVHRPFGQVPTDTVVCFPFCTLAAVDELSDKEEGGDLFVVSSQDLIRISSWDYGHIAVFLKCSILP